MGIQICEVCSGARLALTPNGVLSERIRKGWARSRDLEVGPFPFEKGCRRNRLSCSALIAYYRLLIVPG